MCCNARTSGDRRIAQRFTTSCTRPSAIIHKHLGLVLKGPERELAPLLHPIKPLFCICNTGLKDTQQPYTHRSSALSHCGDASCHTSAGAAVCCACVLSSRCSSGTGLPAWVHDTELATMPRPHIDTGPVRAAPLPGGRGSREACSHTPLQQTGSHSAELFQSLQYGTYVLHFAYSSSLSTGILWSIQ